MAETIADTRRLMSKPQNLNDAYGPPSNFLEIDVSNPQTVGVGRGRFTTYEIRVKTNLPIFKLKESTVRRRYSDFEWLRSELERESKVVVPPLPGKALFRQLPFRGDDGIFDDSFIEERKQGLEQFINNLVERLSHPPYKSRVTKTAIAKERIVKFLARCTRNVRLDARTCLVKSVAKLKLPR
ncbi:Sorting nexin-3 [Chelonia mydas]|uniref:Sorting nexin-3 n=1 Tax=Chelonia mydas TaxID=8469 RepID=M7BQN8_CHEMY|nr:Sorting nexin-3 [Chelonia mydas]